jgi:hypothetical protein
MEEIGTRQRKTLRAAKAQGRILHAAEENRPPELMKNKAVMKVLAGLVD